MTNDEFKERMISEKLIRDSAGDLQSLARLAAVLNNGLASGAFRDVDWSAMFNGPAKQNHRHFCSLLSEKLGEVVEELRDKAATFEVA